MDENTRFLVERMDKGFAEIRDELKELQGFKNRVLGMAMIVSGVVTLLVEALLKS